MKTFLIVVPALILVLALLSLWLGSALALLSFFVGIAGTALFLGATWLLVKLVGRAAKGEKVAPLSGLAAFGALCAKVPLIYLAILFSRALGPFGPTAFLLGLASVYCAVIWRAVLAARD